MTSSKSVSSATISNVALSSNATTSAVPFPDYDRSRLEDIGFMTAIALVTLGNYS